MKYTKEERLGIAKRVYDREMTVEEAAVKYDLNPSGIKGYLRLYRAETGLPARNAGRISTASLGNIKVRKEYEEMSKEELLDALVMARINEARLKKGYCVKGSGAGKEYIPDARIRPDTAPSCLTYMLANVAGHTE